jgi:sigma-B regulation protein RsbQ
MDVITRFNVRSCGSGSTPMMFAHGFGCDQGMWSLIAPAFEREYRVITFDYIGHGGAIRQPFDPERYATLQGYADDVLEICAALDVRHGVFVGHSVSAMIGALAARAEADRFDDLVMIGPSARYINDVDYQGGFEAADIEGLLEMLDSNYVGWASAMAPVIMGNAQRPELGSQLATAFCQTDPDVARHFARVTFMSDNRDDLPSIPTRSLVLQCSDDIIAPEAVGRYVHSHLPAAEFVHLKATGHCPHVSAPEETIAAIRAFLG